MPDFRFEEDEAGPVAGVDEAGRGPLAGPVVAAAVILDRRHLPRGIDDSKRLSAPERAAAFEALMVLVEQGRIAVAVAAASTAEIDRLNILQATLLAMRRAVLRLDPAPATALVDGNRAPDLPCLVRTIVDGDALSLSIAAASIIAKVIRDRAMARLARRYPGYGWERNMGYGTAIHRSALDRLGATPHHRRSFTPLRQLSLGSL